jgi:hypothetical protein
VRVGVRMRARARPRPRARATCLHAAAAKAETSLAERLAEPTSAAEACTPTGLVRGRVGVEG